jgi:hypothetical protein
MAEFNVNQLLTTTVLATVVTVLVSYWILKAAVKTAKTTPTERVGKVR